MKHSTFSGLIYAAALLLCPFAGEAVMKAEFKLPASARAGVYIEDIITGEVITDINGELPLIPASITKAVTTASVLAEYNPDYRFTTSVYIQGKQKNGTVDGDIVIQVCGDPALESSHFPETAGFTDSIATYLTRRGINAVTGTVVIDATAFVDPTAACGVGGRGFCMAIRSGTLLDKFPRQQIHPVDARTHLHAPCSRPCCAPHSGQRLSENRAQARLKAVYQQRHCEARKAGGCVVKPISGRNPTPRNNRENQGCRYSDRQQTGR